MLGTSGRSVGRLELYRDVQLEQPREVLGFAFLVVLATELWALEGGAIVTTGAGIVAMASLKSRAKKLMATTSRMSRAGRLLRIRHNH